MTTYGYARVSSDGQCLDAQREALAAAGAAKIFAEKLSGASAANRKELAKVLAKLESGDVLLVTRLDRLARSTLDLLNVLDRVGKAGAGFRSLADAWADTTTAHGRLMLTTTPLLPKVCNRKTYLGRKIDSQSMAWQLFTDDLLSSEAWLSSSAS